MSNGRPTRRRIVRRIAWIAAAIAAPVGLFVFVRWLREPTYEGAVRFPCGSVPVSMELRGPIDPQRLEYRTPDQSSQEPFPGATPAYPGRVRYVELVVLKSDEIKSPAYVIDAVRFGTFGATVRYRRFDDVEGVFGYFRVPFDMILASDPEIIRHAFLLNDWEREREIWRVYEFRLDDFREGRISIPELTELPTLSEHPRGAEMWDVYQTALDEQRSLELQHDEQIQDELRRRPF